MTIQKSPPSVSFFRLLRVGSLSILLCLITLPSFAQYFHFTQYHYTPLRLNPALVGAQKEAQALFHYRQQSTSTDVQFRTSMLTASYPLLQRGSGRQYGGVGLSVLDDRTGAGGLFTFQSIGLNGAYNVALQANQRLVLGVQANYALKGISTEGFTTGSQYVSGRGYAPDADLGENFDAYRSHYFSLSTGLYWYASDAYDQRKAYAGLTLYDANRPQESFILQSKVPASLLAHAGYRILDQNSLSLTPELLYSLSAGTTYLNLGALASYYLADDRTSHLDVSAHYVIGQAANLGVQFVQPSYILGFSYDLPLNQSTTNTYRSATEILLALKMPVKAGDKRKKKKKRKSKKTPKKKITKSPVAAKKTTPASQLPKTKQPIESQAPPKVPTPADTLSTNPATDPPVTAKKDTTQQKGPELNGYLSFLKEDNAIQFKFNSEDLDESSYPYLDQLAISLQQSPDYRLLIIGHTDDTGSASYNQSLSLRRAQRVADYLAEKGINRSRFTINGKGESQPLVPNINDQQRALNRRVEFTLYQE
ncbi:PorP/SprF family type IX secretion system membrane protein [Rhodocytophaga aerolata]|uniref:PorP/SprF family type IX secretion system membrane protein n=1 Tax=Rhodocytophaga aerolata TaxID=455078 RepID=A0ABT8R7J3_9BACT|nr:PorP/SprF family type IX secretion system membrane protein [Rhodocytophaga aerolata]MDO1448071.1 PorP/SprF family type IX secretion system membrane protein [Rhodocytophaga aerolata]